MEIPSSRIIADDIAQLEEQLSDSSVIRNAGKMKELSGELKHKRELFDALSTLEEVQTEIGEFESAAEGTDAELAEMARQELPDALKKQEVLQSQVETLVIPVDPRDTRDVVLEIRAGAGGEEAALFASELFTAYTRYAQEHGWRVSLIGKSVSEQNGFKEVIAEISGQNVFGTLKYESGVHRVQRVPTTEKQGRIHTSTVTVAILPQAEDVDVEIRNEDLRIDTYRASGAGGQHVNKTDSAVRITHIPTGLVVACQEERSQHKNKAKAMRLLRSRLLEAQEEKKMKAEAQARKSQVGTGDRSEKIRTYNFPQDRITDHRIKENWSNIESVLAGVWDPVFTALHEAARKGHSQGN